MPDSLIGARLGAYEIQQLLGSGGMAVVYQAFDHNLHRLVAVKVLSPEAAAQPGFTARFHQEARLIARLHHPNVVQVYDFGQHGGVAYMVQELLPGPSLAEFLQNANTSQSPLDRLTVLQIVSHLAAGLDAAHTAGIIHRDVKPANALWNSSGALVLTDFGIAKPGETGNLTQVGMILGTPAYLSPEQAQGMPLTPASDIYALGVILYEMLAGRVPFDGSTSMQVLWKHVHEPLPDILVDRPDLPASVGDLLQRALAKDPTGRYARAMDLATALEHSWPQVGVASVSPTLHSAPTQMWQPSPAQAPAVASGATIIAAAPATVPLASETTVAPVASARPASRRPSLLPVLAGVLALLVACGAFLALRATASGETVRLPAATGAPAATDAPEKPVVPTAQSPAAAAGPFDELRALIDAGTADGRLGDTGETLRDLALRAQTELAAGNGDAAAGALQDILNTLSVADDVDPALAAQVRDSVQKIAATYSIALSPIEPQVDTSTSGDNEGGNGNGKGGKGNDNGKGGKGKGGKGK